MFSGTMSSSKSSSSPNSNLLPGEDGMEAWKTAPREYCKLPSSSPSLARVLEMFASSGDRGKMTDGVVFSNDQDLCERDSFFLSFV